MNGRPPGTVMNGALFALLVYTYDAGSEESPRGRERLEAVRVAMLKQGFDIADRDNPRVRELLALATTMLVQSAPSERPADAGP